MTDKLKLGNKMREIPLREDDRDESSAIQIELDADQTFALLDNGKAKLELALEEDLGSCTDSPPWVVKYDREAEVLNIWDPLDNGGEEHEREFEILTYVKGWLRGRLSR